MLYIDSLHSDSHHFYNYINSSAHLPDSTLESNWFVRKSHKATAAGFKPARAEPSGFRVHLLNHSDKLPEGTSLFPSLSHVVHCHWVPTPHHCNSPLTSRSHLKLVSFPTPISSAPQPVSCTIHILHKYLINKHILFPTTGSRILHCYDLSLLSYTLLLDTLSVPYINLPLKSCVTIHFHCQTYTTHQYQPMQPINALL